MKLIIRLIINAIALWAATAVTEGITLGGSSQTDQITTLLAVALIFGLVNALIRPILKAVTCPFYVLTLGLFTFIVNAIMLIITGAVAELFGLPFRVTSFSAAFVGSLVVSLVSFLLSLFLSDERRDDRR